MAQGDFGVIARGDPFLDRGRAVAIKACEKDARLHLGAGNGKSVAQGLQRPPRIFKADGSPAPDSTAAPMRRNGRRIRPIGRRRAMHRR